MKESNTSLQSNVKWGKNIIMCLEVLRPIAEPVLRYSGSVVYWCTNYNLQAVAAPASFFFFFGGGQEKILSGQESEKGQKICFFVIFMLKS